MKFNPNDIRKIENELLLEEMMKGLLLTKNITIKPDQVI